MNVFEQIELAVNNWETSSLRSGPATKLFLGKKENLEMKIVSSRYISKNKSLVLPPFKINGQRLQFRGMTIYPMDDETYCEVLP